MSVNNIFACLSGHLSNLRTSLVDSYYLFKYDAISMDDYPATLLPLFGTINNTTNADFLSRNLLSSKYILVSNVKL